MKQTLEDYIRQDEEFRHALLKLGGGIMKYWAEHPEDDFDIDLFNGYEKQVVEAYLQANKRNRALHSLPDEKLKWDALSWYHHKKGKELKFYTELRPELDKLPKEVKEQADGYFVDYLEDNYREYLRYAYPADIAPIDFYNKVIRAFGVGGLARDCMDYILKDHHHPEVWSKMKSVDVVMTEFYIEEYSAFIIKERCFKKLRQGVKEKLAGKNQDECRREAVKMMNSVKGFARMLYSSSETQITDCTGDYKVDKRWLRGQTEGLTADFRRDGYLKNSFSEYVGILNDIGCIWAAQLLKEHGIDMHKLEKETGAILYPVAEPAQNPDGLDHGKYKYYVDKELSDPLDDQCCIYDEKQAKELLDALRRKKLAEKVQYSPNSKATVPKASGQGLKKSEIKRSLEKIHWALGGVKDMIDRPTDILPEHLQMLGKETKAALQFVISLCDYMIDNGELDISEDLVIIHDEAVKISNGEYGKVPGDALTDERQPIIDEILINVDNMWGEIQHYWEWEENEQRQEAITPPPSHDEDYYGKDEDIFHENLDPGKIANKILLLDRKKANGETIADRNFILILYNVFSSHPGCMTKKQKKKLLNWVKFNCKIYFKTSHLKRVKLDDEEMKKIDLYHEEFANKQPSGKWFFKKEFYRIDPLTKDPKKSIDGAW